ncbi:MAG: arabinofuranosidase catalytic domain-containing protein [Aestuariivirga sp.]|uniref:arabinofuranosidase catalytic domain-containing protein n=1 Tax=Aestuariivirga sp. TaxID=2650926 RepID=UPI00301ADDC2
MATSEPAVVTGAPRIAIDVGGVTRYATYVSGSGTSALTFSYAVQAGDFDADGITVTAPLELNGGSIADVAGNTASNLSFTLPDTSALKVQTYTTAFTTNPITEANASAVGFTIAKAPTGASFTYSITSDGGSGSVTGSGTIGSNSQTVSGLDLSNLPVGTLTLSVTVSTAASGTGAARTATATPGFTGILDSLSPAASFSIRRVRGAYSGPLIRVRRASDGTQQDIGATLLGHLNTQALSSFCGVSSCFDTTWYDQSGNGRDAAQATAANQPRIVNAGVMDTAGRRPSLVWPSAANTTFLRTTVTFSVGAVSVVSQHDDGARTGWISDFVGLFGSTGVSIVGTAAGTSTLWHSPSFQNWARNGAALASSVSAVALPWPWATMYATATPAFGTQWSIGCDRTLALRGWSGPISEFLMFPAALTASDRLSIENSQSAYFGVSVP